MLPVLKDAAAILGLQRNATVISCHRHTYDAGRLREHTLGADILIVAVGGPGLIDSEMVRAGAIVIDIGINALRNDDGSVRLVGDVDAPSVELVAEAVSPVPGGGGPITDMWLLRNTIDAACIQAGGALADRHRAERLGREERRAWAGRG